MSPVLFYQESGFNKSNGKLRHIIGFAHILNIQSMKQSRDR
jgi:hypothetical protein